jgi:hypothetical protein
MTLYAQINNAQLDEIGIYRGTLSSLSWVNDNGDPVDTTTPPNSGAWINVQGITGRRGVAYVLLVDPDADVLNLGVNWQDEPTPQPLNPLPVTPEPVVDDTDPTPEQAPEEQPPDEAPPTRSPTGPSGASTETSGQEP